MSSKSPVRSCDDVDETALSYAEIKALCAGNPLIAEKMQLDNEVAKLRMLKSEHRSQHYRLEDSLLKQFPQQIAAVTERIVGIEKDIAMYAILKEKCVDIQTQNGATSVSAKFPGMVVKDVEYHEKDPAAKALLEACKDVKGRNADVPVGEYMGFKMSLLYESFGQQINLHLRGAMTYKLELGTDALGNISRINNALDKLPERLAGAKEQLANLEKQVAAAKEELANPFAQEAELAEKESRLALLNSDLNIDGDGGMDVINDAENREVEKPETDIRRAEENVSDYRPRYSDAEEQRTGTYGKARPSILTDLDTMSKSVRPPLPGGGKSAEIDI